MERSEERVSLEVGERMTEEEGEEGSGEGGDVDGIFHTSLPLSSCLPQREGRERRRLMMIKMMMKMLIIGRLIGRALGFQVGQKEETSM
jgi:hypothetical protein